MNASLNCQNKMTWATALIQPKLTVNAPGDRYEQEADAMADRVMRMPFGQASARPTQGLQAASVQRKCAHCEQEEREKSKVMRKAESGGGFQAPAGLASILSTTKGGGSSLPVGTRSFMENAFSTDFTQVQVHTDGQAASMSQGIQARAFTHGSDVYFNKDQYQPESGEGRRLLAHELTHVVQQGESFSYIQKAPAKNTAAASPHLDVTPSKNGAPCACLVVVHNDEENARLTAEQMHSHCSYNLTLLNPNHKGREITLPNKVSVDPNAMFPRSITEECLKDEQGCKDFLVKKAASTDKNDIEKFAQIQFFLAVKDCSDSFTLPVIALHNNDVVDTTGYNKSKEKKSDLTRDIDKTTEEGKKKMDELKKLLEKRFGKSIKGGLLTKGKTNIFRWCESNDLSKCHIGDPTRPDHVIWVTNDADFKLLSNQNVNVALQSEAPVAGKGTDSEGDLSTLFINLKDITAKSFNDIAIGVRQLELYRQDLIDLLFSFELTEDSLKLIKAKIVAEIAKINELMKLLFPLHKLRFINFETPGDRFTEQTDADRQTNYVFIADSLKAIGLHCCGSNPTKAEADIKKGLAVAPKPKETPAVKPKEKPIELKPTKK